jgi:hypothetical protein
MAALALTRAGDATRAQAIAGDLSKRFPLDTIISSSWVPTVHPAIELNRGDAARVFGALAHLGLARAYAVSKDTGKARAAYQDCFRMGVLGRGRDDHC